MITIAKNIWFFLFIFLIDSFVLCSVETEKEIKTQSLSHKILFSSIKFILHKEFYALLPTKVSRIVPIASFFLGFVPLFFKIISLKKHSLPDGLVLKKNGENGQWELIDENRTVAITNEGTIAFAKKIIENTNTRLEETVKGIFEETNNNITYIKQMMQLAHQEKEKHLQIEIKNLKKLVDALSEKSLETITEEEHSKHKRIVRKKQDKIYTRTNTEMQYDSKTIYSKKSFFNVDTMNKIFEDKSNEVIPYKYMYLPTGSDHEYVFRLSTTGSSEYSTYKNYLFVIDQEIRDAVTQEITKKENTSYRALRRHAKAFIKKINPAHETLYTLFYIIIASPDYTIRSEKIREFLPSDKQEFNLIAFFGKQIGSESIASIINNFNNKENKVLCLADLNKESKDWIKKNTQNQFKLCINLRENNNRGFLKHPAINIAITPLITSSQKDTIATICFNRFASLCEKKIHGPKEREIIQYNNYIYVFTEKNGLFAYNVDTKEKKHQLIKSISDVIKKFSPDPKKFIETNLYLTLLCNTLTIKNLQGYNKNTIEAGEFEAYQDNIPNKKQLLLSSNSINVLINDISK